MAITTMEVLNAIHASLEPHRGGRNVPDLLSTFTVQFHPGQGLVDDGSVVAPYLIAMHAIALCANTTGRPIAEIVMDIQCELLATTSLDSL